MGLVLYALKYRVTFFVLAIVMLLGGIGSSVVMKKDVLPVVDIPVVVVVWTYSGLDATEMASRITTYTEFTLSDNVDNIRRMESLTIAGETIEKVYFQPNVSIDLAITQVVSASNSIRAVLPPGIQPPIVLRFSASSQPIIQIALSSATVAGSKLYDYALYRMRQSLQTTPGATIPTPYGGAPRLMMVDLDLHSLQAHGITPSQVVDAITSQNVIVPSGLVKMGKTQYEIRLDSAPEPIAALNKIPVKVVDGIPVRVSDVAWVRNGGPPQESYVSANGTRAVLVPIYKAGEASTLTVNNFIKATMPVIRAAAPKGVDIKLLFDQSSFVSDAIFDVIREAAIAAVLTGFAIFVFLGSWRSTLVVLVSIPLSIVTSLTILSFLGETINVMTLGGLALAVGILVDDATVAIENTYRLMEEGHEFRKSVVEGAAGIAKPALISTLAICSAFVSVLFLDGTAKYLFTPQALAVVFAMLTSYVLSRTLVPILIDILVEKEFDDRFGSNSPRGRPEATDGKKPGLITRFQNGFEKHFAKFHRGYVGLLHASVKHRWLTLATAGATLALGAVLFQFVGQDYFPKIDGGQMTLHIRTASGMRLETTSERFAAIEKVVRKTMPGRVDLILDNIGLPAVNYNFAFGDGSFVGFNDGQMLIALKEGSREPVSVYQRRLRRTLHAAFPDTIFYFQPSDLITQTLDFGTITDLDVQVTGRHKAKDLEVAQRLVKKLKGVKGAVDVHLQQIVDAPIFYGDVDREMASEIGINTQQIATVLNISLAGSFQVTPNFWTDPDTGIPHELWVETPEYRTDTLDALKTTPLFVSTGTATNDPGIITMLDSVVRLHRRAEQAVINHLNAEPVFDVDANVQDRDLGSVAADIDKIVQEEQKALPVPDKIVVRGEVESMRNAFLNIGIGLMIAIVAVYLLMVLNYQNWGDPFVVLCALPLVFCGIIISLFVTQTTFSIPSLFGSIMAIGVASANSILLVTFAREHREATGCSAIEAAIEAGETRFRPVLMTASAMFVGLLPMAIGVGAGSEQNAAVARAVLGGVAVGTCSTLLFVPFLYSVLRRGKVRPVEDYA